MPSVSEKATPRPWDCDNEGVIFGIERGINVCSLYPFKREPNRDLILKAVNLFDELVEAVNDVNALVRKAQDILSLYLQPDGDADEAISALLGLLDGPEQREIQKRAFEILAKAKETP